ncbi:MAG: MFS transporter [Oscillospiraceae bacterium]|jgi:Na+/melibiose symporter-like transporter|nr:MFS transporter [Oscillospiraceae bacterium]
MADKGPPKGRRYVGIRETVGFIMYKSGSKMTVGANGEWTDRVLDIDKGVQAVTGLIGTAWDIVNDLFVAAWVDRARTRFGKFRPFMVLYPLYGLPMVLLTYSLPYIFEGTDGTHLPKIVAATVLGMFNELTGTVAGITSMGMEANLTPDPQERLSLITKANLLGFGTSLPKQIFTILRDIISRSSKNTALTAALQMRTLFMVFGVVTITLSGLMSLYFVLVSRERVFGADAIRNQPPSIRESLAALKGNRPLMMIMLAEILEGFNIDGQKGLYVDSILNFANFGLVSGIPGSPVSYASYGYVTRLRQRFSTKTLWIASTYIDHPFLVAIYFFGMLKVRNKAKIARGVTYTFMDLWPMIAAFGVQNTASMALYGCHRVIPDEIRNECIDYGEWKSGFRSEAMVGVIRKLPEKLSVAVGSSLTNLIVKRMGFQTGVNYTRQSERAAKGVFAMATILPAATSLLCAVPKLFYNINQKDRDRMYRELPARRAAAAAALEGVVATAPEHAHR